jgi:hypothetical protein
MSNESAQRFVQWANEELHDGWHTWLLDGAEDCVRWAAEEAAELSRLSERVPAPHVGVEEPSLGVRIAEGIESLFADPEVDVCPA